MCRGLRHANGGHGPIDNTSSHVSEGRINTRGNEADLEGCVRLFLDACARTFSEREREREIPWKIREELHTRGGGKDRQECKQPRETRLSIIKMNN